MAAGALIPIEKLVRCEMVPATQQTKRWGSSGNSVIGVTGPTRWRLIVETERLTMPEARIWSTWLMDRWDRGETFTAFNLFRVRPQGQLGTADGAIGLTVDAANSELDLTGVGTYVAKVGDFVSYRTAAAGYWVGQVRDDAEAATGAVTLKVSPRPLPKHATPAVRRVQALGEFEITTDPFPFEDYVGRTLSFEAMQVIRD